MPASWAQVLHGCVDVEKLLQSTTVSRWYATRKETNKKNAIYMAQSSKSTWRHRAPLSL